MTIIDTPEGIRAFGLLSLRGRMQLTLKTGLGWSAGSPFTQARNILGKAGRPTSRSRARTLEMFEAYLHEEGILRD